MIRFRERENFLMQEIKHFHIQHTTPRDLSYFKGTVFKVLNGFWRKDTFTFNFQDPYGNRMK